MKRRDTILFAIGILLIAGLGYARQRLADTTPPSFYSTYDTGRNGYRALYETLAASGVAVERNERELALLDPSVKTIIETSVRPEEDAGVAVPGLDNADVLVLKRFLQKGGRLIVVAADIGGEADAKLGLPTASASSGSNPKPMLSAMTHGVTSLRGAVLTTFPFAIAKAVPLVATRRGTVAIAYPYGAGKVIAITAPSLFTNLNIGDAGNARFAYNLVAGRGAVAFDERTHGYLEDKSFWSALPLPAQRAVWIMIAVVALALFGANIRFAPPMPLEPPDERDSSAYLRSMAALLRRARSARAAISAFAEDARRRARNRRELNADTQASLAELDRLASLTHPDNGALVRAAALGARLRKDLP